jgi:hypothetical protein
VIFKVSAYDESIAVNWLYHLNSNPFIPPKLPPSESIECKIVKLELNVPSKQMRFNWTMEHPDRLVESSAKLMLQADDWIGEVLWIDSCDYIQLKHSPRSSYSAKMGWHWSDDSLRADTASALSMVPEFPSTSLPLSVLISRLKS